MLIFYLSNHDIRSHFYLHATNLIYLCSVLYRLLTFVHKKKCTTYTHQQWTLVWRYLVTPYKNITKKLKEKLKEKIWESQRGINASQSPILALICVYTGYKIRENRYIALSTIVWLLINYKMPTNEQNHQLLSNIYTQKKHVTKASVLSAIHIAYTLCRGVIPLPCYKTNH